MLHAAHHLLLAAAESAAEPIFFPCYELLGGGGAAARSSIELARSARRPAAYGVSLTIAPCVTAPDSAVYVAISGSACTSKELRLEGADNLSGLEGGRANAFEVHTEDVGAVQSITLRVGPREHAAGASTPRCSALPVDAVELRERSGVHLCFPCHMRLDARNTPITLVAGRTMCALVIEVATGSEKEAGMFGTALLVLEGEGGVCSREIELSHSASHKRPFGRSQIDRFHVGTASIGTLCAVRITQVCAPDAPEADGWFLDYIAVTYAGEPQRALFPCYDWLRPEVGGRAPTRRLPRAEASTELVYTLAVSTSDVHAAGTDARVFATLVGDKASSGERELYVSKTNAIAFERAQMDVFDVPSIPIGTPTLLRLRHDGDQPWSGWHVASASLCTPALAGGGEWLFRCNQWLDKSRGEGKVSIELPAISREKLVLYRVVVKTGGSAEMGLSAGGEVSLRICGQPNQAVDSVLTSPSLHGCLRAVAHQAASMLR
jgi:hypothetical protein